MERVNKDVYYAVLSNGVRLEADSLKTLYHAALREVRDWFGNSLYYTYGWCNLYYGTVIDVYDSGELVDVVYIPEKAYLNIGVSSIDHYTRTTVTKWTVNNW